MINILYILPDTKQGGAETQLLYILNQINKKKFKVHLGLLYKNTELLEAFKSVPNIEIVEFKKNSPYDVSVFYRIHKFLKSEKIEIVHAFMGNHHAYIPALFSANTKAIGSIRSTYLNSLSFTERLSRITFAKLFAKTNNLTLISNSLAGFKLHEGKRFPKTSLICIPNGIDFDKFSHANPKIVVKEFNLENKKVIGIVARLHKLKNHMLLLNILIDLLPIHPNLHLLIVGGGEEYEAITEFVKQNRIQKHVTLTGNRKDIPNLLSAMDIFAFPSEFPEGWPNVVGEAMSAGVPVIAYPSGDIPEIIEEGKTGYIVDTKEAMQARILSILKNPKLSQKISRQAKQKAKKDFTLHQMIQAYERTYQKILTQGIVK